MKISLCIPQYNRIQYLLKNLSVIAEQSYPNIEVVIADDASTDTTQQEIEKLVPNYKYPLIYHRHPKNVGYDANVRKSLELATGEYCMLMGNDDTIAPGETIQALVDFLIANNKPEIGFCNYIEANNPGVPIKRAHFSGVVGAGEEVALKYYRSFSFVAGIVFRKDVFESVNTNKVDGSIYVQMYFAARIITSGGRLFMYETPLILKDIRIDGSMANSYRDTLMKSWKDLKPIDGGLKQVVWAVSEGFKDAGVHARKITYKILKNIYRFTYPYWLFDYRSNSSFVGAVGLMKGLKPSTVKQWRDLAFFQKIKIQFYYLFSTITGLLFPVFIFNKLKLTVYRLIKK